MIKKVLFQGLTTIFAFFSTWFIFSQIDWVELFQIQATTDKTEKKLGELIWAEFQKEGEENVEKDVIVSIDSIVAHICKENKILKESIDVHVLTKDEINAFALPSGHIIIYSGLIQNAENQEELIGVLCHEIAHVQLNHVMKKLIKEMGLSVLISMTTGSAGGEVIKETTRMLSSSAFERSLEREADLKAVDYLINAKVNPEPFANFLYKLSFEDNEMAKYFSWFSTHPDSKERATYIIDYMSENTKSYSQVITDATWDKLKQGTEY